MSVVKLLTLGVDERAELESRVRAQTTAFRDWQRARVVLLAAGVWADGASGVDGQGRRGASCC